MKTLEIKNLHVEVEGKEILGSLTPLCKAIFNISA